MNRSTTTTRLLSIVLAAGMTLSVLLGLDALATPDSAAPAMASTATASRG